MLKKRAKVNTFLGRQGLTIMVQSKAIGEK